MSPAPDERDRIRAAMDRILQTDVEHLVRAVNQLTAHNDSCSTPCPSPAPRSRRCRPNRTRTRATESLRER
ncbi:hypothetical protein ACFO9E_05705 [Streptomyces maoxianensis]|uniref:Uncharacterized protein n=1 Tax=Streptomyces maoxianensis TaxID=1459942 RepID=A0ABV9G281_9ACTN